MYWVLRIIEGEEPLDRTGIHTETYGDVKKLLKKAEVKETELGTEKVKEALKHISYPKYQKN